MSPSGRRIIVSGMIANVPGQGGASWAVLQYVLGLRQLGHDVCFVEPIDAAALRSSGGVLSNSPSATYFTRVMEGFGLASNSALFDAQSRQSVGLPYERMAERFRSSDLLINISGMLRDEGLLSSVPCRLYLDLDPAFTQLWHVDGIDMGFAGHTHFATVGPALARHDCWVPRCGHEWIHTVPPVVIEHWPVARELPSYGLTTVANWRAYGSVELGGLQLGQKAHSLRSFIALPTMTSEQFTLALRIHQDELRDLDALHSNRWHLVDPGQVADTPSSYRSFIQQSWAELGIAKSGYVISACGWFSDRSVCYLASGRPVIAQDTGFGASLPCGEGLFRFSTYDDVLEAIEELRADYRRHSRAARFLAEEHFAAERVLPRLLDRIGAA